MKPADSPRLEVSPGGGVGIYRRGPQEGGFKTSY